MPDQTIDSLVVTLGLDPASFRTGVESALRSLGDIKDGAKDADKGLGDSFKNIGSSVGALAGKFAGLFFAVKGIGSIVGNIKELSYSMWHLGIDSKNVGVSANELRKWQEAAELAGGSAEDATASIGGLQASIFNLRFRGEVSDQLVMLQRLGVAYLTTGGKMRNFADIALEASQHLKNLGFDQATRYQYALSIGLTGGLATAVAQGPEQVKDFLKTATSDNKDINEKTVQSQAELNRSIVSLQYQVADASAITLTRLTPALTALTDKIAPVTSGGIKNATSVSADIVNGFSIMGNHLGSAIYDLVHPEKPATPRGVRDNNPGNLQVYPGYTGAREGRFQVFSDPATGFGKLEQQLQLTFSRGNDTIAKLITAYLGNDSKNNNIPAYIADVMRRTTLYDKTLKASDMEAIARAITEHEGNKALLPQIFANPDAIARAKAAKPSPGVSAAAGAQPAASRATGAPIASTTLQIGTMNVQTQATNAQRMAADMDAALRRKLLAAQVETGYA